MANIIQIKRSTANGTPTSLNAGELAYSNAAQVIYIGSTDGASVVPIGGARNPGTLTANQALVANSTSGINSIQVGNLVFVGSTQTLNANGSVGSAGQVLYSAGSGANAYWATPSASVTGSNTYVQFNDSGSLNAVSSFTFDKSTNTLSVGGGFTANTTLTNVASLAVVGAATVGGSLVVTGNLYASGNTFLVNATAITTNDKALYLANNQGNSALTDGSGFYVGNSATPIASFLYNNATLSFQSNVGLTPSTNNLSLGGASNLWNLYANQIAGTLTTTSQPNITANNANFLGGTAASGYQTTAGLSANVATLTANNTTYLNGQLASYYTNATNITTGTLPMAQLNANVVNTSAAFTFTAVETFQSNLVVGNTTVNSVFSNAQITLNNSNTATLNASSISFGNATVNSVFGLTTITINGATIANSTGANNAFYLGGTAAASYQLTGSSLTANIAAYLPVYTGTVNAAILQTGSGIGATTNGVYANASIIYIGNSTVNSTINATAFTGSANNTTYLNGQLASYYTNATNINAGVLSYQYGGTSQTTYAQGDLLVGNSTSGVSRLTVGTSGYVLQSNGTTVVYAVLDGGSY
jgi:hypothetical protein